jgi:hypothetical protein
LRLDANHKPIRGAALRYLVSIKPDYARINEIDTSGEIMPQLDWLRTTFDAETMYLEAGQRKIWLVVDFESAAALNKLTCICLFKFGAQPTFRPIFTEEENETAIPASLAFMESVS